RAEEARRLLRPTAALAGASTLDEVSEVILDQCRDDPGAVAGGVGRVLEHTDEFELLRSVGFQESRTERWQRFPLQSDLPLADAMRRNEMVELGSVEDRDRLYPGLVGERASGNRGSWLSVPLPFGERAVGGVALAFTGPRVFTDRDLDLVGALGRQAGQAFE